MANSDLPQNQQKLKHLEHNLKEIGDQHKLIHDSLTELQAQAQDTLNQVNASWSKVVNLFVTVDQLRSSCIAFKKEALDQGRPS